MADESFQRPDLSNVRLTPSVFRAEAANYVDAEFRRRQDDLFREHKRQERLKLWDLKYRATENYRRNFEAADRRYQLRMDIIERRYERMLLKMRGVQNSIPGRLIALTKEGRRRQEWQQDLLRVRAGNLRIKAISDFAGRRNELLQRHEADRKAVAQEIRDMRQQHRDERYNNVLMHKRSRDEQIQTHTQRIYQHRAEHARQYELQLTQGQEHSRTRAA